DAGRRARYRCFARQATELGAAAIATAHTADDQAETVLMHLLRGAGTDGLGGIKPVLSIPDSRFQITGSDNPQSAISNLQLIRPLLATSRAAVEAYCAAHGLLFRHDASNADTVYTRSRIRHELLPLLATYNLQIVDALGRTAAVCADDAAFVQQALDRAWPELARQHLGGVTLDGTAWRGLHPSLQRAALRRAYAALGGEDTLSWEQVERARELHGVGKRLPLPGGIGLRVGYGGALTLGLPAAAGPQLLAAAQELRVPDEIELADGWRLHLGLGQPPPTSDRWTIALEAAAIALPMIVRGRRAGDRLRLAGGGSRKVQDVLVDAKIAQPLRARWPIVASADQVVWVAGVRAAAGCLAQPEAPSALWIQIIPAIRNQ
ncbi:MAG: tRNA lysidine(34) synthetase TilS, partial [Roseiflexaceae bacterium]|nr:tRNA lysidine(34) synthetase TilS [Roseiflexaceae bacterium]